MRLDQEGRVQLCPQTLGGAPDSTQHVGAHTQRDASAGIFTPFKLSLSDKGNS